MANYTLPPFGNLDIDLLEDFYHVDIELNGNDVQLDLNFDETSIDPAKLELAKSFIEKLDTFDKQNKVLIQQTYTNEEDDVVKKYVEHHLKELDDETLSGLIDFDNTSIEPAQQLVNKLKLVRVGLYPETEPQFATFDYSIGTDLTDYLVVVNTNQLGELDYMTMEI